MSDFHIQKKRVDVEVWTLDGDEKGTLLVAPFARSHSGHETVLDLMNGPEAFLPVLAEGRVDLFSKACIHALFYEEPLNSPPGITFVEHRVLVQIKGRPPFEALMRDERPPGKERVSDFLNEPSPYIVMLRDGLNVLIVKQHLVRVMPAVNGALPKLGGAKKKPAKRKKR